MRKLHEIHGDILGLLDILEAGDVAAAEAMDKELKLELEDKLAAYYHVINAAAGEIAQAEVVIKNATEYKDRHAKRIDWLEGRVKAAMLAAAMKKLDRPDCRITFVNGRDILVRDDPKNLPADYVDVEIEEVYKADWKKVEADVKAGKEVGKCKIKAGEPYLLYPKLKTVKE